MRTVHCNFQKHTNTLGHEMPSACPQCNQEEETSNTMLYNVFLTKTFKQRFSEKKIQN